MPGASFLARRATTTFRLFSGPRRDLELVEFLPVAGVPQDEVSAGAPPRQSLAVRAESSPATPLGGVLILPSSFPVAAS